MNYSALFVAVVAVIAARGVSADYWLPCDNTVIQSCLLEINYNQYASSKAGLSALKSALGVDVRAISYNGNPTAGGCLLYQVAELCTAARTALEDSGDFGNERTTNSCFFPTGYTGSTLCGKLIATGNPDTAPSGVTSVSEVTNTPSSSSSNTTSTPTSTKTTPSSPGSSSTPSTTPSSSGTTPATVQLPGGGTSTVSGTTGSIPGLQVPAWGRKMNL